MKTFYCTTEAWISHPEPLTAPPYGHGRLVSAETAREAALKYHDFLALSEQRDEIIVFDLSSCPHETYRSVVTFERVR